MILPLVGCFVLAVYVGAEALGFHAFAAPEAETVSEAAALGHAASTLEFIASGQNPNGHFPVRPGMLDSEAHELEPIEAAILGRHEELVRLLRRSGATEPGNERGACLARARLPEVLPDFGVASAVSSDSLLDIAATLRMCSSVS